MWVMVRSLERGPMVHWETEFLSLCLSTCLASFIPLWPSSCTFYYTLWPSCKFPWIKLHSWCWHVHVYEIFLATIEELLGASVGRVNESQDGSQHNTIETYAKEAGLWSHGHGYQLNFFYPPDNTLRRRLVEIDWTK